MINQRNRSRTRIKRRRRIRTVFVISMATALLGTWYGPGPAPAEASHGFCEPVVYAFDPFCFDPFYGDPFYDPYDPFCGPFCCFEPYLPYIPPDFVPLPTTTDRPPRPIVPNNTHVPATGEQEVSGAYSGPVTPGTPEYARLVHNTNPNI